MEKNATNQGEPEESRKIQPTGFQKQFIQTALVCLLAFSCLLIFTPFLAATLLAAVVVISTWPVYDWLLKHSGNRENLSAFLMLLMLILLFFLPMNLLVVNATQGLGEITQWIQEKLRGGGIPALPLWIQELPFAGELIANYWNQLTASRTEQIKVVNMVYQPLSRFLLTIGLSSLQAILQVALVLFISFFLYRDGKSIAHTLCKIANKLGGEIGITLLHLSQNTVAGVMIGIAGTALGQALVALTGFLIAGVPNAMLLSMGTFLVSALPVGPPLFWGGASIWLYLNGETGWALFMVAWGLFAISAVDNFLKPILIAQKASLPLLLILVGVFGGIFAFGFIGMFLGPTLLAVASVLATSWIEGKPTTIQEKHDRDR